MTRWDYFPMCRGPLDPAPDVQGGWQVTSTFGSRPDPLTGQPGNHGGEDLAFRGCGGCEIYAPSAGTLAQGWDPSGGGNWSGITLEDGSYVGIGHADRFAPGASYRRVEAGDVIAYCDSTGGSTGDHVHVCYRAPGQSWYSDPWDILADAQHRIVGEEPDVRYPTEDMTMIRNASDGGVYVLTMDMHGTLGWRLLNGEQAEALDGLGFADLDEVGKGNDERDRYFATFPIFT